MILEINSPSVHGKKFFQCTSGLLIPNHPENHAVASTNNTFVEEICRIALKKSGNLIIR